MAAGIFKCTKEGIVFAGRAYTAQKSDTSNK